MRGACSMVLRDASLAAPLRLIWAGLDLHRPPFAPPPYSVESAASASTPQVACFTTSKGDGGFQYSCFRAVLHYTIVCQRACKVYRSRATVKVDTALTGTKYSTDECTASACRAQHHSRAQSPPHAACDP